MPAIETIISVTEVFSQAAPVVTRDATSKLINEVRVTTPFVVIRGIINRDATEEKNISSIDILVEDAP